MPGETLTAHIRRQVSPSALAGFGVPFLLVLYLGLKAGGYDLIVRGEVGIIAWWAILLGVAIGFLPAVRITRNGWIGIGILGALALWTGLAGLTWGESTERGMVEFSRVLMLLGVFVFLILIQGRDSLRRTVAGVGVAVAIVAFTALASRYHPSWFPESGIPQNYPVARLSHPVDYWNGLAALLAIGVGPLLYLATSARTITARALAAGSLPMVILALYLTASRGGVIEVVVALVVLLILFPKRLLLIPSMFVTAVGFGILFMLISARPELRDSQASELAQSQGTEMIWLTIGVVILVAVAQAGITFAERRGKFAMPEASRTTANRVGIAAGLSLAVILFYAFSSGFVGNRWEEFKEPNPGSETVSRLGNLSSGERYKVWDSAIEASSSEKLLGIGPGTFEFWWAQKGDGEQFVRDAHSLYLEASAEMGPLGFLLVLGLVIFPIGVAIRASSRKGSDERRALLAASTAGMAGFAVAAGVDWAWELTILPVMFLVLAAGVLGPAAETRKGRKTTRFESAPLTLKVKFGLALASVAAIILIAIPVAGTSLVRSSQEHFRAGETEDALDKADSAVAIQPYSATALMQRAQVENSMGNPEAALPDAVEATQAEPHDWRTWYVLSVTARMAGRDQLSRRAEESVSGLRLRVKNNSLLQP